MKKIIFLLFMLCSSFMLACSRQPMPTSSPAPNMPQAEVSASADQSAGYETADASAMAKNQNSIRQDEQLGTRWGDDIDSPTTTVNLERVSNTPVGQTEIRYAAKNFDGKSINSISMGAGQISFSIIDDQQKSLPLYRQGASYFVSAQDGQSYQLHYRNDSNQTYEIVASVDGLDVLDGSAASKNNRGYVLRPHDRLIIDGFRKSESSVASFMFSKPESAYAAHNEQGSIQNTGIIGTVVFALKAPTASKRNPTTYAPTPQAFPADE